MVLMWFSFVLYIYKIDVERCETCFQYHKISLIIMAFNVVRMLTNSLIYSPEVDVFIFLLRNIQWRECNGERVTDVHMYYESLVRVIRFFLSVFLSCVVIRSDGHVCESFMSTVSCLPVAFAVYFAYANGEMLWHVNMCRCVCVHQVCFSI